MSRSELFRGRHFQDEIIVIVLYVRWYLRCPLSYRNLGEMMAGRGLTVDHAGFIVGHLPSRAFR